MTTKKLRRKLIVLCFCLFAAWIITAFPLIVLWYAKDVKGGLAGSDTSKVWHMFVFDIIPGYTAGYLIFGLCLLDFILKSKKSDEESSHDA